MCWVKLACICQGQSPDPIIPLLLDAAAVAGLKVCQCVVGMGPYCVRQASH